jgi:hypothetical protein
MIFENSESILSIPAILKYSARVFLVYWEITCYWLAIRCHELKARTYPVTCGQIWCSVQLLLPCVLRRRCNAVPSCLLHIIRTCNGPFHWHLNSSFLSYIELPYPRTKTASGVVQLTSLFPSISMVSILYIASLSVLALYSDDDGMINECRAGGGMRIGRENQSTRRTPAQVPLHPPQIPRELLKLYWDTELNE